MSRPDAPIDTPEAIAKLRTLRLTMPNKAIAVAMGISETRVRRWSDKHSIPLRADAHDYKRTQPEATDELVRKLWRVVPPIRMEDIGARCDPPISKSAVHRIARRLELPPRGTSARGNTRCGPGPHVSAPAPVRAQRPPGGPTLSRNGFQHSTPEQRAKAHTALVTTVADVPREWPALGAMSFCTFGDPELSMWLIGPLLRAEDAGWRT